MSENVSNILWSMLEFINIAKFWSRCYWSFLNGSKISVTSKMSSCIYVFGCDFFEEFMCQVEPPISLVMLSWTSGFVWTLLWMIFNLMIVLGRRTMNDWAKLRLICLVRKSCIETAIDSSDWTNVASDFSCCVYSFDKSLSFLNFFFYWTKFSEHWIHVSPWVRESPVTDYNILEVGMKLQVLHVTGPCVVVGRLSQDGVDSTFAPIPLPRKGLKL